MIETTVQTGEPVAQAIEKKKVLSWRKNDRMGGYVPVWEEAKPSAKQTINQNLASAENGSEVQSFDQALAYADPGAITQEALPEEEEFGFGDLIDMVNPLHHLPLVGHVYREVTGDEIKPIAKIIGGGVFGGPAGAGMGLVDTIIEYETGSSLTGNVTAMVTEGKMPEYRSQIISDHPEERLNSAVKSLDENPHNLPGTVIGFADLGYGKQEVYEKVTVADGRTAGTMIKTYTKVAPPDPVREPITELNLKPFSFNLDKELE